MAPMTEDAPANWAVIRLRHPIAPVAGNPAAQPPARQRTVAGLPVTMGIPGNWPCGADSTTLTTVAESSERIRRPVQALR